MKMIKPIVNLSKIVDEYDTFVFGFNGVLYNGDIIFPEAASCLRNLAAIGKKIIIISNSCLRVDAMLDLISRNGISMNNLTNVVTAGEILHYKLKFARSQ